MYLNTVFKYNVFKYCPALYLIILLLVQTDSKEVATKMLIFHKEITVVVTVKSYQFGSASSY